MDENNLNEQNLTKKQRREIKKQRKLAEKESEHRKAKFSKIITFVVIIAAVVGVGILIMFAGQGEGDNNGTVSTFDDPTLGNIDAAIIVEEFSDFQCPACASAEPAVMDLVDQYGDRIKFVYNDFPLTTIHSNAKNAAIAGQCANAQDKFWELHDLLFERQSSWANKSGGEAIDAFKEYASELELDTELFNTCLDNKDTEDSVNEDIREANNRNVSSTPTFFVDGERVVGGNDLISAVESALGE